MVLLLLANGADPNIPCKDTTPLWLACFHGLVELVHPLLDNGADPDVLCTGVSPLHVATARGLVEVVHILLAFERPANVNLKSERLGTALHVAASRGHKFVLQALLDYSPNLNVQNRFGETVFHLACSMNSEEVLNLLLDSKLDIDPFIVDHRRGATAAHCVTSLPIFRILIQRWPNLFYALDRSERTPSFYIPCNIVAFLTSLTTKANKHTGEHLHADIPRYADIALVCPSSLKKVSITANKTDSGESTNEELNEASKADSKVVTEQVLAHKAMLYARIPFFANALKSKITKDFSAGSAAGATLELMEMPDYSSEVMHAVVYYAYTDNLKCPKSLLRDLIRAANLLEVPRLAALARAKLAESAGVEPPISRFPVDMASLITSGAFADILIELPSTTASSATSSAPTTSAAASRKYPLHKFILATFSEYFRTMFSIGMSESTSGLVTLESTSPLIFEAFLFWVYTFTLKPTIKSVKDCFRLLELAHNYMNSDLSLPIQTKILVHLSNEDWLGIEDVFAEADRLGAQIVAEQCALRFSSMRESAKKKLPTDVLKRLEKLATPILDDDDDTKPRRPGQTKVRHAYHG